MKRVLVSIASVLAILAAPAARADATTDALKAALQKRLGPEATIRGVERSAMPGVYEVNVGSQLIYSDAKGEHVLIGNMIDTASGENLTQTRFSQVNRIDVSKLPLNDAIKTVKGNGRRKLYVFSDPRCPYCHRLEETLKDMKDLTIYTFLYPVLGPESVDKAKSIWCAKDRTQAWRDWMLDKKDPGNATCDTTALTRNRALGESYGVTGTPTVVLADGSRLPGAVPAAELEKALARQR
ncbi:DsbC family protein [Chitinasiproducens palmae]|uniref:Thiol:disulfide interchange protein n=1 Tax=Chitinasiproducens palmae TaxID=1770053 RepID=A0A1H2PTI8_9BURK|nr:DsbC family protein [Chitinasiproducens palmae]SDV50429.1 Thiol:disulfide interchange protein DsbC [Chitinasiproducens palmae]